MIDNIPITKAALLSDIAIERDPNRLMQYVRSCYDVDVVRAAANRCYDITEGGEK